MEIVLLYFSLYAHLNVLKVMNKILHFLIHVLIVRVHAPQLAACEKVHMLRVCLRWVANSNLSVYFLEVQMHRSFLVFWEDNNVFYSVRTATTSASKKEGKTRSLILTRFVSFVAVDIQSLVTSK